MIVSHSKRCCILPKHAILFVFLRSESAQYFTYANNRIGGRYKKALYVEYTDDAFTTKVNRSSGEMHLGFLGPVIRAEVDDEIKVLFKNQVKQLFKNRASQRVKRNEGSSEYSDEV